MLFQQGTPDTSGYMIAGYVIAFVVMGLYVMSMYLRSRNLKQDISMLEELEKPKEQIAARPAKDNPPKTVTNQRRKK